MFTNDVSPDEYAVLVIGTALLGIHGNLIAEYRVDTVESLRVQSEALDVCRGMIEAKRRELLGADNDG